MEYDPNPTCNAMLAIIQFNSMILMVTISKFDKQQMYIPGVSKNS